MSAVHAAEVRAVRRSGRLRATQVCAGLTLALLAMAAVRLLLGEFTVSAVDFVRILGGADIPGATFIITGSRLPRVAVGIMVGIAFGIAGTLFQTMLRNPLASPDIIGVSHGASAAAVGAIVLAGATGPVVSAAAIVGALVVAMGMHLLSRSGGLGGDRFILIGIGVAAIMQAAINFLMTRADLRTAQEALIWLLGSLGPASGDRAGLLAAALLVLLPAAFVLSRQLGIMELGEEVATGLGVRVKRATLGLTVVAVALAAVATAAAGPVAFVAFLAGPIARRLMGGQPNLVASALVGAVIVLAADHVAAELVPVTLPVGVVTGATGAPFLLWLLAASNKGDRSG